MSETFTELSPDQIADLRSGARTTGLYKQTIENFLNAGIAGADVTNQFQGVKASSAYQQLRKIADRDFQGQVQVIKVTRNGQETIALVRADQ